MPVLSDILIYTLPVAFCAASYKMIGMAAAVRHDHVVPLAEACREDAGFEILQCLPSCDCTLGKYHLY